MVGLGIMLWLMIGCGVGLEEWDEQGEPGGEMEHFWVVMTAPEGWGDDIDGVVSERELTVLQQQGYTLRSKMSAVKADVVQEEASS